ncbi:MAG: DUF418 domain-containing protein [Balneolaceae bacterium]
MNNKSTLKPVGQKERIHVLDALRGFAIFGILVINIRVFGGYSFMAEEARNRMLLADWNAAFDWLHIMFFSGKFYTLFSLLFGIGFAIQFIRASSTDRSFKRHFSRRLFFLLLIGIGHLWGIWFSDILVIYALCGYVLILFKDLSSHKLLWAAFFLLLLPGIHAWYLQIADGGYTTTIYQQLSESWIEADLPKASEEQVTFVMRDVVEVIQSDSWDTILSFNYIGPLLRAYMVSVDLRFIKVLAVFVLGLWTGRQLLLHNLHKNRPLLIRIAIVSFLIGLPLNFMYGMENPFESENSWFLLAKEGLTPFGYVSLTAAFVASVMLLYLTRINKVLTSLFNSVGKTALSNYILQSLIGIFIFYDVGLGLGKYLGSAYLTLAVIVIFAFQIIISNLWLKRYKYGPLEWFWRVLTYGRYIKNKRTS